MSFSQRLGETAALVETQLSGLLDRVAAGGAPDRLVAAMRYAVLGGGKRLRPFLVIESARLFGVAREAALPTAAALECMHCYSLVHDDLPAMDDDDLRRGKPTVHKAYDEWTAILAGDALLTLAFEVLADAGAHADPGVRVELAAALARAAGAGGMVGGQCLDLEAEKLRPRERPRPGDVDRLQSMKTAALFRFACEAGPILAGAGVAARSTLATYGERLGRAFQIADDLLDVEGQPQAMGKATGRDAGKATLVAALGVDGAKIELEALEMQAVSALAPFGEEAATLREAVGFVVRRSG
jgi:farnesyl diphosphate synthase